MFSSQCNSEGGCFETFVSVLAILQTFATVDLTIQSIITITLIIFFYVFSFWGIGALFWLAF